MPIYKVRISKVVTLMTDIGIGVHVSEADADKAAEELVKQLEKGELADAAWQEEAEQFDVEDIWEETK